MQDLQTRSALRLTTVALMAILSVLVSAPTGQAGERCTTADFGGGWGFSFNGVVVGGPFAGSFAAAGQFTADEDGDFSGSDTLSFNGTIIPRSFTGTAVVNANCTGSATLMVTTPVNVFPPFHLYFVLDDHTREARFVQADPGAVITGSARKQR
jgi:hypothetical protein